MRSAHFVSCENWSTEYGGQCRDRTCDIFDVNEYRPGQPVESWPSALFLKAGRSLFGQDNSVQEGSVNQSALCETPLPTFAEYWRKCLTASHDPRHDTSTHLYRYFTECNRLIYTGISNQPWERHKAHCKNAWWMPHARLIRLEYFPIRRIAEIAETISIEDEGPDCNCHVRMQAREWPVPYRWYQKETGGAFVGQDSAWFTLNQFCHISAPCPAPDWWCDGFKNPPLPEDD